MQASRVVRSPGRRGADRVLLQAGLRCPHRRLIAGSGSSRQARIAELERHAVGDVARLNQQWDVHAARSLAVVLPRPTRRRRTPRRRQRYLVTIERMCDAHVLSSGVREHRSGDPPPQSDRTGRWSTGLRESPQSDSFGGGSADPGRHRRASVDRSESRPLAVADQPIPQHRSRLGAPHSTVTYSRTIPADIIVDPQAGASRSTKSSEAHTRPAIEHLRKSLERVHWFQNSRSSAVEGNRRGGSSPSSSWAHPWKVRMPPPGQEPALPRVG